MWTMVVESAKLFRADRWTVSYFTETKFAGKSAYRMRPLKELADERRSTVDPRQYGSEPIVYVGLKDGRSNTGEMMEFSPRPASSLKAQAKRFRDGDVL